MVQKIRLKEKEDMDCGNRRNKDGMFARLQFKLGKTSDELYMIIRRL